MNVWLEMGRPSTRKENAKTGYRMYVLSPPRIFGLLSPNIILEKYKILFSIRYVEYVYSYACSLFSLNNF